MLEYLIPLLIIVALIVLNGLFVAAEFAILGVRPTRMAQLSEQGHSAARGIKAILDDPVRQDQYIATAQIGITLASLGLGMYGEATVAHWLEEPFARWLGLGIEAAHAVAVVVALSLMTFAHVVVGEMVPKSLALQYAERTAFAISGVMGLIRRVFAPAVLLLNAIGNAVLRVFGIPVRVERRLYAPDELELVVAESAEGGMIDSQQEQLIQNILDFGERQVDQVMTPRTQIVGLPLDLPAAELPQRMAEARRSRIVIYEGDLDHVVGMVLVKEAIARLLAHPDGVSVRELLRPMPVVPETAPIGNMLAAFKRSRTHIALVIDEYGGTAGVVTLEDLVEEVVGEVRDEFDTAELPPLREVTPGVLLVRGDLLLDDLRDTTDLLLPDELPDVDTVAGLVVALLGRPAHIGDTVTLPNAHARVEAVDGLAVRLVRLEAQPADATAHQTYK
jgi:CBS domain containing-hemolysin-like protein